MSATSLTPLMQQYFKIKEQYAHTLVLFQVGDFYELFFDDALTVSREVGITLTKRGTYNGQPIPLCGVPVHTVDHYIIKLVKAGHRVALCDQLTPAQTGKIVERGVTCVYTPGTLTDERMLDEKRSCTAAFIARDTYTTVCISLDLSRTHLSVILISADDDARADQALLRELARCMPYEVFVVPSPAASSLSRLIKHHGYSAAPWTRDPRTLGSLMSEMKAWVFAQDYSSPLIAKSPTALAALEYLYAFLQDYHRDALRMAPVVETIVPDEYLILDSATQHHLELVVNSYDATRRHTLYEVLDRACTAMGSRRIAQWIRYPLRSADMLEYRYTMIEALIPEVAQDRLATPFKLIGDLERLVGRIALGRAQVHDYQRLISVLEGMSLLHEQATRCALAVQEAVAALPRCAELAQQLKAALLPLGSEHPGKINHGYDEELDRLRLLCADGTQAVLACERAEQERTGIPSLKIRQSPLHGYALEITHTHLEKVPERYQLVQALVNKNRYLTDEVRTLEHELRMAHTLCEEREELLYEQIVSATLHWVPHLRKAAEGVACLDALYSLARCAQEYRYVRPQVCTQPGITYTRGRHPVVERSAPHAFIPNNLSLHERLRTWIITGPNMGGKSTFMRQTALMIVMAQMGSFVPADAATLGICDAIYTRIGASDQVSQGKSTFFVEMEEAARMCQCATARSLVLLDEVGRGTSTYDGCAIAYAVVEHLHTYNRPLMIFATHYHELQQLVEHYPDMAMYHAASAQTAQGIVLLHTIQPGPAQGSFGLDVAAQAGIPAPVVQRARVLADQLSAHTPSTSALNFTPAQIDSAAQELKQALLEVSLDDLSPRQAWEFLHSLQHKCRV